MTTFSLAQLQDLRAFLDFTATQLEHECSSQHLKFFQSGGVVGVHCVLTEYDSRKRHGHRKDGYEPYVTVVQTGLLGPIALTSLFSVGTGRSQFIEQHLVTNCPPEIKPFAAQDKTLVRLWQHHTEIDDSSSKDEPVRLSSVGCDSQKRIDSDLALLTRLLRWDYWPAWRPNTQ